LRHWICVMLCISLLFSLVGCGLSGGPTEADKILEKYAGGGSVSADVDLCFTGRYSLLAMTLQWSGTADDSSLSLSAPSELCGLTLRVKDQKAVATEGTMLYTGHIGSYPQSPVTLLPYALKLWQSGYMADSTRDKKDGRDAIVTRQTDGDGATLYTWFDRETFLPFFMEWVYNERVIYSATLKDVTFVPSTDTE